MASFVGLAFYGSRNLWSRYKNIDVVVNWLLQFETNFSNSLELFSVNFWKRHSVWNKKIKLRYNWNQLETIIMLAQSIIPAWFNSDQWEAFEFIWTNRPQLIKPLWVLWPQIRSFFKSSHQNEMSFWGKIAKCSDLCMKCNCWRVKYTGSIVEMVLFFYISKRPLLAPISTAFIPKVFL